MHSPAATDHQSRLLEAAADELARLDTLADIAPPAVEIALRLSCTAQAATPQSIHASLVSLTAALAGAAPVDAPVSWLGDWAGLVEDEERRVRTGMLPTAARIAAQARAIGIASRAAESASRDAALDEVLRSGAAPRPALIRAIEAWRLVRFDAFAEVIPALLLCAAGSTNRLRLLPFVGLAEPAAPLSAPIGDAADLTAFRLSALDECAAAARGRRLALRSALDAMRGDDDALASLGRAAIGARDALGVLRQQLAVSVPGLSQSLGCSRPAAGDALERLVERGLAREITGRQRDRVFVDAHTWTIVVAES